MADDELVIPATESTTAVPVLPTEIALEEPKKADELIKELLNQCTGEVNATLDKYGCEFEVSMILKTGTITPNVAVVLKKNK